MHLTTLDWVIVVLSLGVTFVPAIVLARRAGRNITEFFAAGRQAPWWLIGISMVATTFSTDTPNLVTNLVREAASPSNWVWWSFLLTGMATVFFYARLWRRSGVLTDLEFYELRYAGRRRRSCAGFAPSTSGLFFNCRDHRNRQPGGENRGRALRLAAGRNARHLRCGPIVFAATAGLWGVMVTDMIQFGITMTSAFAAAYFAIHAPGVGGLHGLVDNLAGAPAALDPAELRRLEGRSRRLRHSDDRSVVVGVVSGRGAGRRELRRAANARGAHRVRRALRHVRFQACTSVAPVAVDHRRARLDDRLSDAARHSDAPSRRSHPTLIGNDIAYPAMLIFLPTGFAGFMVAGIFAAYRSTIETHLNWGTSYLVHDFYQRFIAPGASQHELVFAGRLVTALLMALGVALTFVLDNAKDAFNLLLSIGAGTGLIYLLRWFWWRINAWSEVSAMIASFGAALAFFVAARTGHAVASTTALLTTIGITTAVWLVVTYLTPPVGEETLSAFYAKVRPAGPGWAAIRRRSGLGPSPDSLPMALLGWVLGVASVYGALFATGSFIYGRPIAGALCSLVAGLAVIGLLAIGRRLWRPVAGPAPLEG